MTLHSDVERTDRSLYEEDNITSNTKHQVDSQRAEEDIKMLSAESVYSSKLAQNNYALVFMGVSFLSSARKFKDTLM